MALVVGVDLGSGARAVALDRPAAWWYAQPARGTSRRTGRHRASPIPRCGWPLSIACSPNWVWTRRRAIAVGGQSPTTVPAAGGLAITHMHPAGATLDPHSQHGEQSAALRAHDANVAPMQLWDWVLLQCGAPRVQGRWPGDPELPGYGNVVATGAPCGEANGTGGIAPGTVLVPGAQDAYLRVLGSRHRRTWPRARSRRPKRRARRRGRRGRTTHRDVRVAGRRDGHRHRRRARGRRTVSSSSGGRASPASPSRGCTLAATAPPAHRAVALPYLEGERAPRWDQRSPRRDHRAVIGAHRRRHRTGAGGVDRVRARAHRPRTRRARSGDRTPGDRRHTRAQPVLVARSRPRCWKCRSRCPSTRSSRRTARRSQPARPSAGGPSPVRAAPATGRGLQHASSNPNRPR